jgi:hypothetical protein
MTKFDPDIKPCCPAILFNFLELWRVVFEPNQVWTELDFGFNLNIASAHMLASFSFLWRTPAAALYLPLLDAEAVASVTTPSCRSPLRALECLTPR